MKFKLKSFNKELSINPRVVNVVELHNKNLFSKFVECFVNEVGEEGEIPYLLFDNDFNSISPKNKMIINYQLPFIDFDNKLLVGSIYSQFSSLLRDDETKLTSVIEGYNEIVDAIYDFNLSMRCSYDFMVEFDEKVFMKSFGLKPLVHESSSLLDRIIFYFNFLLDACVDKPVVFVNLKIFLSEKDLGRVYEQAFLNNISLFLLESVPDVREFEHEDKIVVDQDFIEL